MSVKESIQSAIEAVFDNSPALASMLAKLKIEPDDTISTFCTNGVTLKYSPRFVATGDILSPSGPLLVSEIQWIIMHELGHLFLGHHLRCSGKVSKEDNIAADLALDSLLNQFGVPLSKRLSDFVCMPGQGVYSAMPPGRSMEFYRSQLPGKGEGKGEGTSLGEIEAPPALTEADKATLEQEWQQAVAEAVNAAKSQGTMPGWLTEVAKSAYGKSKLDWRAGLRRFMSKFSTSGTSWARPSRRQFGGKLILPCNMSQGSGRGLVIVDTSGSMSEAECNVALRELECILLSFPQAKVVMRQYDTQLTNEKHFTKNDFPLRVPHTWLGRGGTDLTEAFAQAKKEAGKFQWFVVVSDMFWDYKAVCNPGIPTIWLVTSNISAKPNFGEVVTNVK